MCGLKRTNFLFPFRRHHAFVTGEVFDNRCGFELPVLVQQRGHAIGDHRAHFEGQQSTGLQMIGRLRDQAGDDFRQMRATRDAQLAKRPS